MVESRGRLHAGAGGGRDACPPPNSILASWPFTATGLETGLSQTPMFGTDFFLPNQKLKLAILSRVLFTQIPVEEQPTEHGLCVVCVCPRGVDQRGVRAKKAVVA